MKNILIALLGFVLILTLKSCESYESYEVTDNCSNESILDQDIHDFYTSFALITEKVHQGLNGSTIIELENFRNSLVDKTNQEIIDLLSQNFGLTSDQINDMVSKASIVNAHFNTVEGMETYMTNLTDKWVVNECFEVHYDLGISFGENYNIIQTRKPCWQVALTGIFGGELAVAGGIMSGNGYAIGAGAVAYVDAIITMGSGGCY